MAQTNLQLYLELARRGWSERDLGAVRRAYELATDLFAGQLRPSGKTFVAHLVGTASAVAAADGRGDLVLAGLLHAAYTHGEFGDGRAGAGERRRATVRGAIGDEAESLVARYAELRYSPATIEHWLASASTISSEERDLVVLRLANEVDDRADLGTRFADRGGDAMSGDAAFARMIALAVALGESSLADLMHRVADSGAAVRVPEVLRSTAHRSVLLAPRSHRPRLSVGLRDLLAGARARLRRVPLLRRAYRSLRTRLP